jgi:hypothetical protein
VYWIDPSFEKGFRLDYTAIVIHAISREGSQIKEPAIYIQLSLSDQDEDSVTELYFVPSNANPSVDDIFLALSECSSLHADEDLT